MVVLPRFFARQWESATSPFVFGGDHPLVTDWHPRWAQQVGTKWANETLTEWKMLRMSLRFGSTTAIPPAS